MTMEMDSDNERLGTEVLTQPALTSDVRQRMEESILTEDKQFVALAIIIRDMNTFAKSNARMFLKVKKFIEKAEEALD